MPWPSLTDGLPLRLPYRRILAELVAPFVDPVLLPPVARLCRRQRRDRVAALARPPRRQPAPARARRRSPRRCWRPPPGTRRRSIRGWLDGLDSKGRFALLKLMTGALRVGVSARLAKTALAAHGGVDVAEIEEVWHGATPPYEATLPLARGAGPRPEAGTAAMFRPLMLSHPIEDRELAALDPQAFAAEWKWDGIRVQLSANGFATRLFSRSGDDISSGFPDIIEAFAAFRRRRRWRASDRQARRRSALQRPAAAPQPQDRHEQARQPAPGPHPPL